MRRAFFAVVVLTFHGLGCSTPGPVRETRVELEPVVIGPDTNGTVRALGAVGMFKDASQAYTNGKLEAAARRFLELCEVFPESPQAPHARFNAGIALLRLGKLGEAEKALTLARELFVARGTANDVADADRQLIRCYEEQKRWDRLIPAAQALMQRVKLGVTERIEMEVRLGVAKYELGRLAEAERWLRRALEGHRQNLSVPSLQGNAYVSRAQFLIGSVYGELFTSVRFRLPVERMRRDLSDKSSFFLKAQAAYLGCVRLGHPKWSVAAGFQLGKLYEDFYDAMMEAEVPSDLSAEEKEIYFAELKKKIKPMVHRAIDVYERNLAMSDRQHDGAEWAKRTSLQLERMRGILRTEFRDIPD